ncbi:MULTISPECIES: flagellar hook-basal body complex protein FliE [Bacillus amyloliquefaciens group]|uniref:flagellar hook-basal body complex protein FliE n=1 Tax=Bacillus amyloliquefaciens group TaxID=1938374 RepID=UPI000699FD20|nr:MULTISPECIES: flagellar hook-basal body complex protein FliE [Bacillus amyloliquefaciens group]ATX83995.1 flagellar hook-basal body complex protein FliE [Bacillus velezensis]KNX34584.1 flagellar hook-basal body protein FliE [Bacillus amyloliquefaciens]MCR4367673.1 flagellar hook-basal body complex protein FliE [Bacillus amyloliquefaciens]MCR4385786.1 flagellar hook-basal body complex protein FliE [Bacillus amyloliquefaciens]MCV3200218.1 flagellar hook-basal body complex protein FliE [Bacill
MVNAITPFQLQQTQNTQNVTNQINQTQKTDSSNQTSFSELLKNSIDSLNESQVKSDQITNELAAGKDVNLDEVMIAAQKANISLTAATEFRNKAVEAYQEIMRMQM